MAPTNFFNVLFLEIIQHKKPVPERLGFVVTDVVHTRPHGVELGRERCRASWGGWPPLGTQNRLAGVRDQDRETECRLQVTDPPTHHEGGLTAVAQEEPRDRIKA